MRPGQRRAARHPGAASGVGRRGRESALRGLRAWLSQEGVMSISGIQPDAVFLPLLGPLLGEGKVRCVYEWVGLTEMVIEIGRFFALRLEPDQVGYVAPGDWDSA